jgi:hypothetical protein
LRKSLPKNEPLNQLGVRFHEGIQPIAGWFTIKKKRFIAG